MNCREFEAIINDLACEHLMLASKRVQALAHKESCARCAARLAEERLLTERLRLVAESETIETPARVRASLMAAFAERNGSAIAPAAAVPASVTPAVATARWPRWSVAAAAAILILLAVVALRLLNGGIPAGPTETAGTPETAPRVESPALPPQEPQRAGAQDPTTASGTPRQDIVEEQSGQSQRTAAANRKVRRPAATAPPANLVARNEVVTDYIPLTYLSDSTAIDSGMVVRVQVPRATLISMGLPMNVENSQELVKADVVVGDDGVARAIRFVHDLAPSADGKQAK
jgi:hypothetical protein